MADEPESDEKFDLRLAWPRDGVIDPVGWQGEADGIEDPAELGEVVADEAADFPAHEEPPRDDAQAAPDEPAVAQAPLEGEPEHAAAISTPSGSAALPSPLEQIVAVVDELGARFDSISGMATALRDAVSANLGSYTAEVGLVESTGAAALSEYRERSLRMLVQLRRVFPADSAALGWISGNLSETSGTVDGTLAVLAGASDQARRALDAGREATEAFLGAVAALGDRLVRSIGDVEKSIRDGGEMVHADALGDIRDAVAQSVELLSAATYGDAHPARPRLETQVERLAAELHKFNERDAAVSVLSRAVDATEQTRSELTGLVGRLSGIESGIDPAVQAELTRMADELQAVRRRLTLRSKAPVALTDDQLEALAQAIAAQIEAPTAAPRRTPSRTASSRARRQRPLRPQRD